MNLQENIRRILREETDSGKYLKAVKVIANDYKNENFVCDIDVRYYRGFYEVGVKIDKKEFEKKYENEDINYATILMAEHLKTLQKTIRQEIKNFLPVDVMVWINKTNCEKSLNESTFFRRRFNLDEFKRLLPVNAEQVYGETESYRQFKYELTLRVVESIMWNEHELGWEDLPEQEEIDFVNKLSDVFYTIF